MAVFCEAVILGAKSPLEVDVKSKIDVAAGDVVPMPTCAYKIETVKSKKQSMCFINPPYKISLS